MYVSVPGVDWPRESFGSDRGSPIVQPELRLRPAAAVAALRTATDSVGMFSSSFARIRQPVGNHPFFGEVGGIRERGLNRDGRQRWVALHDLLRGETLGQVVSPAPPKPECGCPECRPSRADAHDNLRAMASTGLMPCPNRAMASRCFANSPYAMKRTLRSITRLKAGRFN